MQCRGGDSGGFPTTVERRRRPGADKTNLLALPGTSWALSFSIRSLVEGLKIQASRTETPSTPALEMTSCQGIGSPVKT